MTPQKEKHLKQLLSNAEVLIDDKYRRGAELHTDNLLDKSIIELNYEALMECIDQLTYLLTQRELLLREKNAAYQKDIISSDAMAQSRMGIRLSVPKAKVRSNGVKSRKILFKAKD